MAFSSYCFCGADLKGNSKDNRYKAYDYTFLSSRAVPFGVIRESDVIVKELIFLESYMNENRKIVVNKGSFRNLVGDHVK
ncbi:hypothetical protein K5X82_08875 [Halosquirtibacter xylanolyticus]|uniref:hypothetical protein n=1 Tax=Halosquirtibacter xylanolyticus TaxID=3374599 RepID=UPI003749994C|nr:hypothetical protein K5X82_08875 [Prolixibacteraceae bacterium]